MSSNNILNFQESTTILKKKKFGNLLKYHVCVCVCVRAPRVCVCVCGCMCEIFCYELKNIKQTLINNGFPNYFVDEQIKLMINNKNKINDKSYVTQSNDNRINLFYCNQMHPNFRFDEKILKNIIHSYIPPTDNKIRFIIYCKKKKIKLSC